MDDILIMTQIRWQNLRPVRLLSQTFNRLKLQQYPNKTFIGRIDKGFDFLGYRFSRQPLQPAAITVKKHVEKLRRLYEQQSANKKASSEELLGFWGSTFSVGCGGVLPGWVGLGLRFATTQVTEICKA